MTSTRTTQRNRPLPRLMRTGRLGGLLRYASAAGLMIATLAVLRLLDGQVAGVRLSVLVGATGVAAFAGGFGPGLLAMALALGGADVLFFELPSSVAIAPARGEELIRLAIFAVVELLVVWGGGALRRALTLLDAERREASASEERFRLLAENAKDIVYRFRLSPVHRFEYVSSATTRLLGYSPSEHYADPDLWIHRVVPEDMPLVRDVDRLTSGQPVVTRVHCKDGELIWLEHRASALRDEKGEMVAVQGIARDVSEQKRMESAERLLLESSRLLAESLDARATVARVAALAARSGFCDLCTLVTREATNSGLAKVEVVAQSPRCRTPAAGLEGFARATVGREGALSGADFPPGLAEHAGPLGLKLALLEPLQSRRGTVGTMAFARCTHRSFDDFDRGTAQRLASRCAMALENAELFARAQLALRQRDDVLAIVSHDLKNPLGAIMLSAGIIERSTRGRHELHRIELNAQTIRRAAERMNRLIRDLLDFSALDSGKLTFEWNNLDPNGLLREALDAFATPALERMVELELEPAPETLWVRADRDRIVQVLSNLVGNALNATNPSGKVTLSARQVDGNVELTVRDTGKGIIPEDLPFLFERFRRGHAGYEGTGLGLAIARALVEAHGGRIWVESKVGHGTAVTFSLPLVARSEETVHLTTQ